MEKRKNCCRPSLNQISAHQPLNPRRVSLVFGLFLLFLSGISLPAQSLFPGAVGLGTSSRSAYGSGVIPQIITVDNLNDSGAGSFRQAIELSGPRVVVFNISGTLHTTRPLIVKHPWLFVAGQSAPGDGITFSGAPFIVETHDVLVQSVRFRLGAGYPRKADCVSITGTQRPVFNVVFDRCSFALGQDENVGILNAGKGITISRSIIGYALDKWDHSCGLLAMNVEELTLIGNIFAFNRDRNPTVRGGTRKVEIINNLIYNSGAHAVYLGSRGPENKPIEAVIAGNLYITGPDNMNPFLLSVHNNAPGTLKAYWSGNVTKHKSEVFRSLKKQLFDKSNRFTPLEYPPFTPSLIEPEPAISLLNKMPHCAGPAPFRPDAVDSLIISYMQTGSGKIIRTENELNLKEPASQSVYRKFECPGNPHHYPSGSVFTNLELHLNSLLVGENR